jgi:hypothetical protein
MFMRREGSNETTARSIGGARESQAAEEGDRGRSATTPSEIPVKGWKDILFRVYENVSRHRVMALAAGITYYTILAIFPAIAALVAVYGLFSDPSAIARHLDQLGGFLPGGAIDVARAANAGFLEGVSIARSDLSARPRSIPLERECRDEVVIRHAEHRLR